MSLCAQQLLAFKVPTTLFQVSMAKAEPGGLKMSFRETVPELRVKRNSLPSDLIYGELGGFIRHEVTISATDSKVSIQHEVIESNQFHGEFGLLCYI